MTIKLDFYLVWGKEEANKEETLGWWEFKTVKPLWKNNLEVSGIFKQIPIIGFSHSTPRHLTKINKNLCSDETQNPIHSGYCGFIQTRHYSDVHQVMNG
jgi:hypothetical protein